MSQILVKIIFNGGEIKRVLKPPETVLCVRRIKILACRSQVKLFWFQRT